MKFAVIGDIHSNIVALESVLKHIETKDVDFILCTGDMVGYAPFPNEVIDLIRRCNILSIQGNHDKAIGDSEAITDYKYDEQLNMASRSVIFTKKTISDKNRHYLKNLPEQLRLSTGNLEILMVHGSPQNIAQYLFEDSNELTEVVHEMKEDLLICGHTHKPYYKEISGKHIINAGSVGKPKHGNPNATYVIIDLVLKDVKVDIIEVAYDFEHTALAIENNDMFPTEFAQLLRKG